MSNKSYHLISKRRIYILCGLSFSLMLFAMSMYKAKKLSFGPAIFLAHLGLPIPTAIGFGLACGALRLKQP